jgi:Na+-transporting NADH:ubiquinone oxidoreductase subunit E
MWFMRLMLILFASMLTSNIALTYFLGMCPFVTISKNIRVATGMGVAVTCVMTITAAANWLINHFLLVPLNLLFLQFLVFIVTIATIVQMLEMVIDRYMPKLYHAFGIFLPLITVNCAILGISLFMDLRAYTLSQTVVYAFGSGVGWTLAIVTMGALRKRLVFSHPPSAFGDMGITAILAGLMALAFIGFAGVANL